MMREKAESTGIILETFIKKPIENTGWQVWPNINKINEADHIYT